MNIIEKTFNINSDKLPTKKEFKQIDRYEYIKRTYTYLSDEWITDFAKYTNKFSKVIEVGCGAGWLSYWINKYNGHVDYATDNCSWNDFNFCNHVIKDDSCDFIQNNYADLIIMSWPPYDNDFAINIWDNMKKGQTLIYIGEDYGGCTANDEFNELFSFSNYSKSLNKNYLNFFGIHDHIYIKIK